MLKTEMLRDSNGKFAGKVTKRYQLRKVYVVNGPFVAKNGRRYELQWKLARPYIAK